MEADKKTEQSDNTIEVFEIPVEPYMGDELKRLTEDAFNSSTKYIVLDFSSVDVITSSSFSKMLRLCKRARDNDKCVILCCVGSGTKRLFQATGLESVFNIVGWTAEETVKSLESFHAICHEVNGVNVISVLGEPEICDELKRLSETVFMFTKDYVVIDFSSIQRMTPASLSEMKTFFEKLKNDPKPFLVCGINTTIMEALASRGISGRMLLECGARDITWKIKSHIKDRDAGEIKIVKAEMDPEPEFGAQLGVLLKEHDFANVHLIIDLSNVGIINRESMDLMEELKKRLRKEYRKLVLFNVGDMSKTCVESSEYLFEMFDDINILKDSFYPWR